MQLTLYRIEELRSSRIWNAVDPSEPLDGGFEDGDDFVLEFEDWDEAQVFVDQVGGTVELHRQGTFGNRMWIGGGITQQAAE